MQAVTTELRAIPGIQLVMATSGSFFLGSVNVGPDYVHGAARAHVLIRAPVAWSPGR